MSRQIKEVLELSKSSQTGGKNLRLIAEFFVVNIFPAIVFLYILSYWILPIDWNEFEEYDGSWVYASGKLRSLNLAVGKDCWFTYGPVAHWFGPPLGQESYQPWPYYVLGLFVAALFFVCLRKLLAHRSVGLVSRTATFVCFLCGLSLGMNQQPDAYRLYNVTAQHESYLILAILLTFTTGYCLERSKIWWLYVLMALSIVGLHFKFSLGVLATFCFLIALVHSGMSRRLTIKHMTYVVGAYLIITVAFFAATSGTLDIVQYLRLGLEVSSKYSEGSIDGAIRPRLYGLGVTFALSGIFMGLIASYRLPKPAFLAFLVTLLFSIFVLFKHGHVRANWYHLTFFYGTLIPFFTIMIMLAWSAYRSTSSRVQLAAIVLCMSIWVLALDKGVIDSSRDVRTLMTRISEDLSDIPERIQRGFHGQEQKVLAEKVAHLNARHEQLFMFLSDRCRSLAEHGGKPRITFYPWELMFAEAIDGCELLPSPGLQLYTTGPNSKIQQMESDFLSSSKRPDIVVIGPEAADHRNSVSEYTDILSQLYRVYGVTGAVGNYVVLEPHEPVPESSETIKCFPKVAGDRGEFLRLRFGGMDTYHEFLWRLATVFFKSPEFTITVSAKKGQDREVNFAFRGYISQLKHGVYVYDDSIDKLILATFRRADPIADWPTKTDILTESSSAQLFVDATATLSRNDGVWNLPVVPKHLPLEVSFCVFNKTLHGGRHAVD